MISSVHSTTGTLTSFNSRNTPISAVTPEPKRKILILRRSYCAKAVYCRVLYETLRTYSSVQGVFKTAVEDTILTTHNCAGDPVNMSIPKGSEILVNILAMHYHR